MAFKSYQVAEIEQSIQQMLDNKAKELGYDNMNSCSKYLRQSSPFYEECTKLLDWCDAVWLKAYELQSSMTEVPTVEELIAEMPDYE